MVRPLRRASLAVGLLTALATGLSSSAAPASWVVLRDQQASHDTLRTSSDCMRGNDREGCAQRDTETEPSLAVNPRNPNNAVVAFQTGRIGAGGASATGYATSFDAGRSWTRGILPGFTTRVSDPVVAFDGDGRVFVNSLVLGDLGGKLAVNSSVDGGRTWGPPSFFVNGNIPGTDKNWMTVDTGTGAGHHPGRVYVVWADTVFFYAYSDDHAKTWTAAPTGLPLSPTNGVGAQPVVLPDGSLVVCYTTVAGAPNPTNPPAPDATLTSIVCHLAPAAGSVPTGGPLAFGPAVQVATYHGVDVPGQRAGESLIAAAGDPRTGAVYVAWNDARFRTDLHNDIVLATSTNRGVSWTAPVRVNPRDVYQDHFTPMLGVDSRGTVLVGYRQRYSPGTDPSLYGTDVATMLQASHDGGRTFSRPLRVDSRVSDTRFAADSGGDVFLGDYDELGVGGDLVYLARAEPVRLSQHEKPGFPNFHQRTWVSVVGPPTGVLIGSHPPRRTRPSSPHEQLAGTGSGTTLTWIGLVFLLLTVCAGHRLKRRRISSIQGESSWKTIP